MPTDLKASPSAVDLHVLAGAAAERQVAYAGELVMTDVPPGGMAALVATR